jgi:tripartite-type tricarboxylate transporter receptor subunit TctC
MAVAPDIPTIAEQGLPGYEAVQWFGLLLPANTPKEITKRLHGAVTVILTEPQLQKVFAADGVETSPSANPDDFGSFIRSELVKWAKVVKDAGITAQ